MKLRNKKTDPLIEDEKIRKACNTRQNLAKETNETI